MLRLRLLELAVATRAESRGDVGYKDQNPSITRKIWFPAFLILFISVRLHRVGLAIAFAAD
jgi:hypothetical protein